MNTFFYTTYIICLEYELPNSIIVILTKVFLRLTVLSVADKTSKSCIWTFKWTKHHLIGMVVVDEGSRTWQGSRWRVDWWATSTPFHTCCNHRTVQLLSLTISLLVFPEEILSKVGSEVDFLQLFFSQHDMLYLHMRNMDKGQCHKIYFPSQQCEKNYTTFRVVDYSHH